MVFNLANLANRWSTEGYVARWICGEWTSIQGWESVISNAVIGAHYLVVASLVAMFWRRWGLRWQTGVAGAGFFIACGGSHIMDSIIFWWPIYPFKADWDVGQAIMVDVFLYQFLRYELKSLKSPNELKVLLAETDAIANSTDDAFYIADENGDCVYVNDKLCELIGYSRSETVGLNMHRMIHYADAKGGTVPQHQSRILQPLATGQKVSLSVDTIWKRHGISAQVAWESSPIEVEGQPVRRVRVVIRELTPEAYLNALSTNKETTQMLIMVRSVLYATPVPIVITDSSDQCLFINSAAQERLGVSEHAYTGSVVDHQILPSHTIRQHDRTGLKYSVIELSE